MSQFLIIAAAHFLALLSPGPDFFLVVRMSVNAGWRIATGACLGIALANGVFIVAALGGISVFRPESRLFLVIQLAGCLYLLYIGGLFIRHAGTSALAAVAGDDHQACRNHSWWHGATMGFLSGILNPKNALFYVSLASLLASAHTSVGWKIFYGLWMFSVVLLWDILIATIMGNNVVLKRLSGALPWIERISGGFLILLAVVVIAAMAANFDQIPLG